MNLHFDRGRKWRDDIRDEAVMERLREYSGILLALTGEVKNWSLWPPGINIHYLQIQLSWHKDIIQMTDIFVLLWTHTEEILLNTGSCAAF